MIFTYLRMNLITAAFGIFLFNHDCRGKEHLGCYADNRTDRLLPTLAKVSNSNTVDLCIDTCKKIGKTYAGVEYGQECWCGNSQGFPRRGVTVAPDITTQMCNTQCKGNASQVCGGLSYINIYSVCPRGRYRHPEGGVGNCDNECYCNASHICLYSMGQCPDGCQDGWYGANCSFTNGNGLSTMDYTDTSHITTGQEHFGCYVDSGSDRLLPTKGDNSANNTVDTCIDICKGKGITYAGVEYGQECWCGDLDSFSRNGVSEAPDMKGQWCNFACAGNASQLCGGISHTNVYSVCPRGRYHDQDGDVGNCDSECYCNGSHICLYSTGQCPGGCQGGWYGASCSLTNSQATPQSGSTSMEEVTLTGIVVGVAMALLLILVVTAVFLVCFNRRRPSGKESRNAVMLPDVLCGEVDLEV